jgi:hypothetical protein
MLVQFVMLTVFIRGTDELKGYVLRFNPANTAAGFAIEHSSVFRLHVPITMWMSITLGEDGKMTSLRPP